MDFFSFNYKPKDFKKGDRDKTLPEILEMKPSKISLDFFTKYEKEISEAGLRPETISAIHFLSDLRNKGDIFDKCYKPGEQSHMKRFSPRPMPMQQAPPPPPPVQEPVLSENDARPLIGNQEGGGRRKHKSRKRRSIGKDRGIGKHSIDKHSSGDHTECTHSGGKRSRGKRSSKRSKRSGKHSSGKHSSGKHSSGKHSSGKRSTKHKRKHRRTYKGGAVAGPNDLLNLSNPAPPLPAYKPKFDTSNPLKL